MELDPLVRQYLAEINSLETPSIQTRTLTEVRAASDAKDRELAAPGPRVGAVWDLVIGGPFREIPLRLYFPAGVSKDDILPALVYFHGSGFVVSNIDCYDHVCRILCDLAKCVVVAVDYCKAPEFRFPKPVEEAWVATRWVWNNASNLEIDPSRIAIGGDSAGGCLATVVAQRALRERRELPVCQLLVYPVTDTRLDTPSYVSFARGYGLDAEQMNWFFNQYFAEGDERTGVWAAPLRALNLERMPATTLIAAGFDPLFCEGKAYADRLRASNVPVEYVNFDGAIHGFWTATARFPELANQAHVIAAKALRRAFGSE